MLPFHYSLLFIYYLFTQSVCIFLLDVCYDYYDYNFGIINAFHFISCFCFLDQLFSYLMYLLMVIFSLIIVVFFSNVCVQVSYKSVNEGVSWRGIHTFKVKFLPFFPSFLLLLLFSKLAIVPNSLGNKSIIWCFNGYCFRLFFDFWRKIMQVILLDWILYRFRICRNPRMWWYKIDVNQIIIWICNLFMKKNNFYKINSFYRAKLFEIECGELSKGT